MSILNHLEESLKSDIPAYMEFLRRFNPKKKQIFVFYEGDEDAAFYQQFIWKVKGVDVSLEEIVAGCKNNVIKIHDSLDWDHYNKNQIIFIVDRDLSYWLEEKEAFDNNVFVTDGYSFENYIVNKLSFIDWIERFMGFARASKTEIERMAREFEDVLYSFRELMMPIMAKAVVAKRRDRTISLSDYKLTNHLSFTVEVNHIILPSRTVGTIQNYLRSFSNRIEVKYVVMDMNRGYRDVAKAFFPNAKIIIDRLHVVRYCTEAMDNVRRSFQKTLPDDQKKYFKRSRKLLLAHRDRLTKEDRAAVDVMLRFSEKLLQAYALKEAFYDFMAASSRAEADRKLDFWLDSCDLLNLPEFNDCRKMLRNWRPYILNAFDIHLSNGFTEGCNNAIKTLKRVAFGFRNFASFRARILLAANPCPNI